MRIGFVIDDSLDRPDGVQQYVLTLGAWYAKQGHEVHYICTNTKRDDLNNVHSISSATPIHFNKNSLSFARPIKKSDVRRFFNEHQFDMLHIQLPHNPLFAGRIIAGAPKEITIIGTFHVAPYGRLESFAMRVLRSVYRSSRKRIQQLYAVSSVAQPYAEHAYQMPAKVVPNPINLKAFHGKRVKDADSNTDIVEVRFMGRLVPRKGCRHLVNALKAIILEEGITNVRLTVGGKGPQLDELKRLTKDSNLEEYVRFVGFVAETEKPDFLRAADLIVFPSTGGESFGIVLLEAMAAGSCVIAGDNPGYRQVLVPERALFNPERSEEFRNILVDHIKHPAKRRKLVQLQSRQVKQYDVEKIGNQILEDYQKIKR